MRIHRIPHTGGPGRQPAGGPPDHEGVSWLPSRAWWILFHGLQSLAIFTALRGRKPLLTSLSSGSPASSHLPPRGPTGLFPSHRPLLEFTGLYSAHRPPLGGLYSHLRHAGGHHRFPMCKCTLRVLWGPLGGCHPNRASSSQCELGGQAARPVGPPHSLQILEAGGCEVGGRQKGV